MYASPSRSGYASPLGEVIGGVPGGWQKPTLGALPTQNTGAIIGSAAASGAGRLDLELANPAAVSAEPYAGAVWEWPVVGLNGGALTRLLASDPIRAFLKLGAVKQDVIAWVGIRNPTNSHGIAWGLRWKTGGTWECVRSVNTGSGWSAPTAASASSASTAAVLGCADPGTSGGAQVSSTAAAIDAAGVPVNTTNVNVARASTNLTGPFTTAFVAVGWATGSGGSAGPIQLGVSALFTSLLDDGEADPFV